MRNKNRNRFYQGFFALGLGLSILALWHLLFIWWKPAEYQIDIIAGTGKIGIRISDHPVATELAEALGGAVSGTSANLSGKPPCKNASEVLSSVGGNVDLILDGGETPGKIGSTILDVTTQPPLILREGIVAKENLEKFY